MTNTSSSTPDPMQNMQQQAMPFAMPPFYGNPFMSPFMPQGAPEGQAPAMPPNFGPQPPMAGNNGQMGFFVTPAQYQEMMQQYFQQMMASAAFNMPFPMQQQFARPESQASSIKADESLGAAIGQLDISDRNLSPKPTKDELITCNGESSSETRASTSNKENTPNDDTESVASSKSAENSSSEAANGPRKSSTETGPQPGDKESRTASLIQKQMSEIEKEITRRTQNKNIKQMDDAELAELMGHLPAAVAQPPMAAPIPQQSQNGHHPAVVETPSIASIAQARLSMGQPGGLIEPPPQAANPVKKRTSHSSENGGPEGDEPVWVMRDSYLRRLQRDQEQTTTTTPSTVSGEWPNEHHQQSPTNEQGPERDEQETDRLLVEKDVSPAKDRRASHKSSKETLVHEPAVLIEGVLFRARYLGSTQLVCEGRSTKTARMAQAQEAVARVKAPEGELQPSTDIDLFISTEKIMVLNTDLQRISDTDVRQDILMDHALRTISYIADIGDLVVLMARRMASSGSDDACNRSDGVRKSARVICHVFESEEAAFIAQSIGQAFQVAYVEFLRANGIDDPSYLRQIDYQEVLNSQELLGEELEMFSRKETQKDVVIPKKPGEALGVVVVESGWGSMLPTVVLAHMAPTGPAARSNQLNVGDQIININGISLVGLPLSAAQKNIQNAKTATAVRLTVVSTPPVVEVRIRRPDTKYQLGFSVQNGVICSLLRGGIAERGGIRVGHRIIEINHHSVVAVAHDRIVNMLATAVGEIQMKTMPTSMFRLLTGQEIPNYI
ncbi:unnamed protein product, partial [Mesorhabditis spiculigera]